MIDGKIKDTVDIDGTSYDLNWDDGWAVSAIVPFLGHRRFTALNGEILRDTVIIAIRSKLAAKQTRINDYNHYLDTVRVIKPLRVAANTATKELNRAVQTVYDARGSLLLLDRFTDFLEAVDLPLYYTDNDGEFRILASALTVAGIIKLQNLAATHRLALVKLVEQDNYTLLTFKPLL